MRKLPVLFCMLLFSLTCPEVRAEGFPSSPGGYPGGYGARVHGSLYTASHAPSQADLIVESVEFTPSRTILTIRSVSRGPRKVRLRPTTRLVCHMAGGKTRKLSVKEAYGISRTTEYRTLLPGEVFQVAFAALSPERVLGFDFLEDPASRHRELFNIYQIRLGRPIVPVAPRPPARPAPPRRGR